MIPTLLLIAMMTVESNGFNWAIGDNGKSWGVLQLQEAYIQDAAEYAGEDWVHGDAMNRETSIKIVNAYMQRYANQKRLGRYATAEDIARIHNGGPNGYKKSATDKYWFKVKRQLIKLNALDLASGKTKINLN